MLIGLVEAVGQSAWSEDLRQELAAHYRTSREQVASMVRASLGEETEDTGGNDRHDREVVRNSMNEVTAQFAPIFIRDNLSSLKNEVGEEMGQVYRQKEVVGWMYHFVQ